MSFRYVYTKGMGFARVCILWVLVLQFQTVHAQSDEVGNKVFVLEPVAAPIFITKAGSRIYPCNGFVNARLIPVVYDELVTMSRTNGLKRPSRSICHYNISSVSLAGRVVPLYTVDFYVSENSMRNCLQGIRCNDFRSMTFKMKNGKLAFHYLVTGLNSANRTVTKQMCVTPEGRILSASSGC